MLPRSKAPIVNINDSTFVCIRRDRSMVSNNDPHMCPIGYDVSRLWLAIDNNVWPYLSNFGISPISWRGNSLTCNPVRRTRQSEHQHRSNHTHISLDA